MPKIVNYDEKKSEIAHKALYAFAFEGFHKTSLARIAEMCRIGRTTIYEYFRNKDEIFAYSLNHSFDRIKIDIRQILETPGLDNLQRITALIRAILAFFYEDKRVLLLLLEHSLRISRENQEIAARIRERALEIQKLFESLLSTGIAAKEIRPLDPRRTALTLGTLVEASIFQFSFNGQITLEETQKGIEELLEGLRA